MDWWLLDIVYHALVEGLTQVLCTLVAHKLRWVPLRVGPALGEDLHWLVDNLLWLLIIDDELLLRMTLQLLCILDVRYVHVSLWYVLIWVSEAY